MSEKAIKEKTTVGKTILLQDLGVFLFIASMAGASAITALSDQSLLAQHLILIFANLLIALLVVMRARIAGPVVTGLSILVFAIYKVYSYLANDTPVEWTAYLWFVILLMTLGGLTLFISLHSSIEAVNAILYQRIDELTVMDPVTGLENIRSMIRTLSRYMALSIRKGTDMGLMMIRLRYAQEIRKVLSTQQFNTLRHNMARIVEDLLRMEDRVFSMDEQGSMGVIYFSPENGALVVKNRIIEAIEKADLMPDLNEKSLRVEISIVYRQFDAAMGKDSVKYISDLEKEFAYEV